MEEEMLKEVLKEARAEMKKYGPGTAEYQDAARTFIEVQKILNDREKEAERLRVEEKDLTEKRRIDETDKAERRKIEEKKIDTEALKEKERLRVEEDDLVMKRNIDDVDRAEKRRIEEKRIDAEADARLKEILVEKQKNGITKGQILQYAVYGAGLIFVVGFEHFAPITSKLASSVFRKVI